MLDDRINYSTLARYGRFFSTFRLGFCVMAKAPKKVLDVNDDEVWQARVDELNAQAARMRAAHGSKQEEKGDDANVLTKVISPSTEPQQAAPLDADARAAALRQVASHQGLKLVIVPPAELASAPVPEARAPRARAMAKQVKAAEIKTAPGSSKGMTFAEMVEAKIAEMAACQRANTLKDLIAAEYPSIWRAYDAGVPLADIATMLTQAHDREIKVGTFRAGFLAMAAAKGDRPRRARASNKERGK